MVAEDLKEERLWAAYLNEAVDLEDLARRINELWDAIRVEDRTPPEAVQRCWLLADFLGSRMAPALPTFGGQEPASQLGILSWDAERFLTTGNQIVDRKTGTEIPLPAR